MSTQIERLKRALLRQRKELLLRKIQLRDEEETLPIHEQEFEEEARLLEDAEQLARLDERTQRQLDEIDLALSKADAQTLGLCEMCRQPIEPRRLEAIPQTRLCLSCAEELELRGKTLAPAGELLTAPPGEESQPEPPGEPRESELTDEQLSQALLERLGEDERLDLDELRLEVLSGQVILEGLLPTEGQREILYKILADEFEVYDPDDRLRVDPEPWESEDRSPGLQDEEDETSAVRRRAADDVETLSEDAFDAEREELPYSPPGRPLPDDS